MKGTSMRVLLMTNIFPNALDPSDAAYNRRQFSELGKLCDVEVLALVPWFPGAGLVGDRLRAGRLARLPRRWHVDGLDVRHPRVLYVPRIGRRWSGALYTASLLPIVSSSRADVLVGAFAYPDGWAAVALARMLGVPAVVKVHGTDVHTLAAGPLADKLRWALRGARAVVGPSRPLVERAIELGADPRHARVIPNGIDAELFHPRDRLEARRALDVPQEGKQILFVGRLEPQKGTDELLVAFEALRAKRPDARLVMIGDGVSRSAHEQLVRERGLPVLFAGWQSHAEVADWLAASDVLALPSWAEGTPNVVLEALASGRPVVATRIGGIPDVMRDPRLGALVSPRATGELADALDRMLDGSHDPEAIARSANLSAWPESARGLCEVLERARPQRRQAV
jgi:glycosyltransferase involved in cell wall biosynthesis